MPSHTPYVPVLLLLAALGAGCGPDQPAATARQPRSYGRPTTSRTSASA